MACGGCGKKTGNVQYQLRLPDGSTQNYDTLAQAQAALNSTGTRRGATIKAVAKAP